MNNKGSQGLIKSDVCVIRDVLNQNVDLSVSTVDQSGIKKLNLPFSAIMSPMVDIPYEKADNYARKLNFERRDLQYKLLSVMSIVVMIFQLFVSTFSAIAFKNGFKPFYRSDVLKRFKECDLVISCSDENFKESASLFSLNLYWVIAWWSMLFSRTWEVLIARYLGKKIILFPNSVGPFRTIIGRYLAKLALNCCDHVLIREAISLEIVKSLRVHSNIVITADTALLLPLVSNSHNSFRKPVVGICLGIYGNTISEAETNHHILSYATAIDEAIDRYGFHVVFLPHYISGFRYDDLEITRLIMEKMKNISNAQLVLAPTVDEFKNILSQMDLVITSKMHPAIFATSQHVPTLCIAYDQKQLGYFNRLNMENCVISTNSISSDKIISTIDYIWNDRENIRISLIEQISILKKNVRNEIATVLKRSLK